jgi:hypothetical protein
MSLEAAREHEVRVRELFCLIFNPERLNALVGVPQGDFIEKPISASRLRYELCPVRV